MRIGNDRRQPPALSSEQHRLMDDYLSRAMAGLEQTADLLEEIRRENIPLNAPDDLRKLDLIHRDLRRQAKMLSPIRDGFRERARLLSMRRAHALAEQAGREAEPVL